jgi:D-serine deaminase-like pyridoxal phosphate-dependent protein
MTDCGALAVSKDTGPYPGYGKVIWPDHATMWDLGRVSQEHGTLVRAKGEEAASGKGGLLDVGEVVRVLPQHACLVCAGFPWIYVVEDGGEVVKDVWVTWKGW